MGSTIGSLGGQRGNAATVDWDMVAEALIVAAGREIEETPESSVQADAGQRLGMALARNHRADVPIDEVLASAVSALRRELELDRNRVRDTTQRNSDLSSLDDPGLAFGYEDGRGERHVLF